jgi:translation initiation factor 5B
VKDEVDKRVYNIVSQLSERGFDSERFDRIDDFTKQIAIVPVSGSTGEGISDLLMVLSGLSQQFLKDRITLSDVGRGTILEVKETKGFGTTIDVILYDGQIRKGDYLIIGGKHPTVTKIKALLTPRLLQELRVEKRFESVDEISAASGIKISAPDLDNVIAGSPIIAVRTEQEVDNAKELVQMEVEEVEFSKSIDGVIVKADTLGSLEAMIKLLTQEGISIMKAEVGTINKEDVNELQSLKEKIILAFNVKISDEIKNQAKDLEVKIFDNNVIYRLIEEYKEWTYQRKERELEKKLESIIRPVELKLLKGCVFRQSNPAIFGVEVVRGYLKSGVLMKREDGKFIGRIKEIQKEGQNVMEAKKGDKVAVSIEDVTIGRTINEGDIIFSVLHEHDLAVLREVWDRLSEDERNLLNEISD